MARDILIKPNRGSTGSNVFPEIQFNGLSASSIKLRVDDDGSVVYSGTYGVLFNVTDSKDGLLHSVNDVSGLPILQVYSYDYVQMGKWDSNTFIVNSDKVGIGMTSPSVKLHVNDSTRVTKIGTYSYSYAVSSSIEGVYFTSSISNGSQNAGVFGVSRPTGLTSHSFSTFAGVIGSIIWERDTSFAPVGSQGLALSGKLYGVVGQLFIAAPSGGTAQGGAGVCSLLYNTYAGTTVSTMMNYRADWGGSNQGYVGNYYGYYQVPSASSAPNVGNRWGVYVEDSLAANVFLGNMAIGTTTSATTSNYRLIVSGTTSTTALRVTNGAVAGYTLVSDSSGNATWANPGSTGLTGSVTTTTGASALMVGCSASIPTGNAMTAWAYIVGKSPSGATSAVGGRVEGTFRNVGGTLTSVGVTSNISEDFSSGNPSFTLVASGTYVTVQVTGFVGATISWYGTMNYNTI